MKLIWVSRIVRELELRTYTLLAILSFISCKRQKWKERVGSPCTITVRKKFNRNPRLFCKVIKIKLSSLFIIQLHIVKKSISWYCKQLKLFLVIVNYLKPNWGRSHTFTITNRMMFRNIFNIFHHKGLINVINYS